MTFRVLENPNVPNELKSFVATEAVRAAEARAKAENERRDEARKRREQIAAGVEEARQRAKERAEQEKGRRELAAKQLEDSEREGFFKKAPGATEADWLRNKQSVLDEAMREGRSPVNRQSRGF